MEEKISPYIHKRVSALAFVFFACLQSALVWAAGPVAFDIPAGEAAKTLLQFYAQSNVQVLYLADTVRDIKTRSVRGKFEAAAALQQMLEGSGLTFEFESDRNVVIKPVSAAVAGDPIPADGQAASLEERTDESIVPPEGLVREAGTSLVKNASEMVVTGSFIRGALDAVSPLIFITKKEMKETGYATVQDALQSLTLSTGVAQNEDFGGVGNFNRGAGVSLHGLGTGATLVLINGRRQPNAGLNADFVDVSNVPWSLVERIEVLPDGSSALYGSDAIAGVVNIILREDLKGGETQARFGSAPDGAAEAVGSQLFGGYWDGGKWLMGYQYSKRTSLAAADRAYTASADKRTLGGSDYRSIRSNPGNILNPRTFQPQFAIPSGQDGTALTPADLLPATQNLYNRFSASELLPSKSTHHAYVSAAHRLTDRVELSAEAGYSIRDIEYETFASDQLLLVPSSNPFFVDPFGGSSSVIVAYNFEKDLGRFHGVGTTQNINGVLHGRIDLGAAWELSTSAAYSQERLRFAGYNQADTAAVNRALADPNPLTAFNPFGDGSHTNPATLAAIRSIQSNRALSDIATASVLLDGPLLSLPTGIIKMAMGAEHRKEGLDRDLRGIPQHYNRTVSAVYSELSVPLVGNLNHARSIPRLDLSLAGRNEKYSDFGDTFNPKVGLSWVPFEALKFRSSWGSSFRAPKLIDLYDTSQNGSGMTVLPDPTVASRQSIVLVRQGNNPDLTEERAETWTLGVDLIPNFIRNLEVSLTWYSTAYKDQVIQPGGSPPSGILLQEDRWAAVITRNPTLAQINAICSSPEFAGPPSQCSSAVIAAIIDIRLRNLAITNTHGFDLDLDYSLLTKKGYFEFGLKGSHISSFMQAFTRTSPAVDIVDTFRNPLDLKLRGELGWSQRGRNQSGFGVDVSIDYAGSYRNPESALQKRIGDWTTIDLRLGYQTKRGNGWLNNVDVSLNASNLLDRAPPFVDHERGYDYVNAKPFGRVLSLYLQKNW